MSGIPSSGVGPTEPDHKPPSANNALQGSEAGGRLVLVFHVLFCQPLSLSLSPFGGATLTFQNHPCQLSPSFLFVFAVVFLVLLRLVRPQKVGLGRQLQHTPLSFAVLLVLTLFIIFTEAHSPVSDGFDRWLGYISDVALVGYLIRMYAQIYRRGSHDSDRTV